MMSASQYWKLGEVKCVLVLRLLAICPSTGKNFFP